MKSLLLTIKYHQKNQLVIPGKHRIAMCNQEISDIPWLKPSDKTFGSASQAAKAMFPQKEIIVVCFIT